MRSQPGGGVLRGHLCPGNRGRAKPGRGVQASRGTLDLLLEIGLVRMRGRRRSPGRPITFATTDAFLEHYGLASLNDLPGAQEMKTLGLLGGDAPFNFTAPNLDAATEDEDPLDDGDAPEFSRDYLIEDEQPRGGR